MLRSIAFATCAFSLLGCVDPPDWSPPPPEVEVTTRRALLLRLSEADLAGARSLTLPAQHGLSVLNASERGLWSVEVRGATAGLRARAGGRALSPDGAGGLRSQLPVAPGATLSLIPAQPSSSLVVVLRDDSGRALTLHVERQGAL